MRTPLRSGRAGLVCLVLAALSGGCQTLHPSTPLTVLVRDAETHAPLPEATVRLWRFGSHSEEHDQKFTTGPDGTATPHVAPPDEGGVMVEVNAAGYLPSHSPLPQDVTDALASAKRFHPYKGPPLSVTVEAFAGPRPKAELIIPSSYRGIVKAEIRGRADGPWQAGQRAFTYTLPPGSNGVIRLDGPMVFDLPSGPEIVAKFSNGSPIPSDAKNTEVAFRWIRRNGNDVYFVVGTSVDAETARRQLGANDIESGPPPKKSDGGGGRGGGHGGGRGGRGGGMGGGGMGGGGMGGP
ncbi:hypothetical protein [Frigoriglobus tundricola]|uniref:Carboxypeptidase regulatory-like domain-containing protein n=1 Tax=Frigoriglobus tundricola TaxID=2774151 RepID=A0A6M5YSK5_9BACT|nr:hypothetical protein [Frigoriglobus tundricola]QJW96283.1 hypothetical protein FTUN_3840 [Frigoriglobus tundricola]